MYQNVKGVGRIMVRDCQFPAHFLLTEVTEKFQFCNF